MEDRSVHCLGLGEKVFRQLGQGVRREVRRDVLGELEMKVLFASAPPPSQGPPAKAQTNTQTKTMPGMMRKILSHAAVFKNSMHGLVDCQACRSCA